MSLTLNEVWSNFKYDDSANYDESTLYYIEYLKDHKKKHSRYYKNSFSDKLSFAFDIKEMTDIDNRPMSNFKLSNWNDPFVIEIRASLEDLVFKTDLPDNFKIDHHWVDDQTTTSVYFFDEDLEEVGLYFTWYKHRGRTDMIVNHYLQVCQLRELVALHKYMSKHGLLLND